MPRTLWVPVLLAALAASVATARAQPDRSGADFFETAVRPLLVENCLKCHGAETVKGGLRLDDPAHLLAGGQSGPAVVPGNPNESLLIEAINHDGLEMPPRKKLAPEQIETLTRWVEMGAPLPASSEGVSVRRRDPGAPVFSEEDRALWAFRPLGDPTPPALEGDTWSRSPIDRFILSKLASEGLSPAPEASPATLIRRLSFDLTGLPPTPEEVAAFEQDPSPDAYERLVDRLLASPRYGEQWGRHWLDLVRYAESDGHRQDAYRPAAWRYRDYVIRAFNQDRPYDRFVREQLAGDEIDPDDPELRVATGYLRHGPYEFNQRDVMGQWRDILNDITDVTAEVFLGLSVACARCHDHKFDPILQVDYYRLQAFFVAVQPRDDLKLARAAEVADHAVRSAAWDLASADLREDMRRIEQPLREKAAADAVSKFPEGIRAILSKAEAERTPHEQQLAALAFRQVMEEWAKVPDQVKGPAKAEYDRLRARLKELEALRPPALPATLAMTDVGPVAPPTVVPGDRSGRTIEPGFLSLLDEASAEVTPRPASPGTTGRRSALADWLTRPDNQLSTRVIVNRLWQHHFGRGLVATPSDLGRLGEAPSHPELLDWLARRHVQDGWSLKSLHRLILTSATYRQSGHAHASDAARTQDPENRWLWHFAPRRLEAEEIRDAMLLVSGELEARPGGASLNADRPARGVLTKVLRNTRDDLLDAFDAPDHILSAAQRNVTTTPTQALLMLNHPWTLARGEVLARRLAAEAGPDAGARLDRAYRLCFGRAPLPEETADALAFLERQRRAGLSEDRAWADLAHALLISNEFLYVD